MNLKEIEGYLSPNKVSKKYNISRINVVAMCNRGLQFSGDEAIKTCLGWLIHPQAAERVWGKRRENEL